MNQRTHNFNAGPAALPLEVLKQAQEELVDYRGIGMSLMEVSHRSKEYEQINEETQQLFRELLNIPSNYKILFLQGGANTQFAMIPMNFLRPGRAAAYVLTGSWSKKAYQEAKIFGDAFVAASSEDSHYARTPDLSGLELKDNPAYLHVTSNETIGGIQFKQFPDTGNVPLIADMSSDIMSRPVDVSQFAMIYAGAQKNLGPSGVTLVILREDLVQDAPGPIANMLKYTTHVNANSLYNTPPVYSVYMMNLVLQWIRRQGGLQAIEQRNLLKSKAIYDVIDASEGYYRGLAEPGSRSPMNITWRMKDEELEKKFVAESVRNGFVGLKGHRSVGGLRASAYNAVELESCKALGELMVDFQQRNA